MHFSNDHRIADISIIVKVYDENKKIECGLEEGSMLRLDKFLCEMNIGTRSQVKKELKRRFVTVNGEIVTKPEHKVNENRDKVVYKGELLSYRKYVYYMLNKPAGVVSATQDNTCQTVTELLKNTGYGGLFPVGRLDKDTEGLLLMTNDGELAHHLLSPRKHVSKVYDVELKEKLSEAEGKRLEAGVDIGEDKLTLPAKVEYVAEKRIYLTITEGKFHQVKRMLQAVDNEVVFLRRIAMGELVLDEKLAPGEYRELSEEEIDELKNIE